MTQIKSFKAIVYNQEKVQDLSQVVCPPYDVISSEEQTALHNLNPYNFIHIVLGKDKPSDNNENNKYIRALKHYEDWLKEGILVEDEKPCIYFYKQEYKVFGQKHSRLGFIALMRLGDPKDSKIFPHEKTHAEAKEDRLRLWSLLRSNLSSIFVCFSDKQKKVEKIFNKLSRNKPFMEAVDKDKTHHCVWRLDDPDLIEEIASALANQQLFIADGHHRYEVAQEYRRMRASRKDKLTGREPFNYVMTYFTNMDSRDLQIFPMHRIVKNLPKDLEFLEEFFRVDKLKTIEELNILLAKAGLNEHAFGLYTKGAIKLLRLKNKLLINQHIKEGSKEFRSLDATILKYFIFDRIGIKSEDIIYTKDIKEATFMVDENKAVASFIINPVKIEQLRAIALNGERMPPKTTYFYPKVLSGLTIYKME